MINIFHPERWITRFSQVTYINQINLNSHISCYKLQQITLYLIFIIRKKNIEEGFSLIWKICDDFASAGFFLA